MHSGNKPEEQFGMSPLRYTVAGMPHNLPERALLQAADDFNEHRFFRLTGRQRLFVDEYFKNGLDEGAAAKASFLIDKNADDIEAARLGRRLLKKKYIAAAVEAGWNYHREAVKLSFQDVVDEIKLLAFSNMGDYFCNDGNGDPHLVMPQDHERHKLAAIQEITVDSYQEGRGENKREVKRVKIKLYNKLEALEKLLKVLNVKGVAEPEAESSAPATTTNNVSVINLVPVPSGSFLPAPEAPTGPLIEHTPLINIAAKPLPSNQ